MGGGCLYTLLSFSGNLTGLRNKAYNVKKRERQPLTFMECSVQERVIEEQAASFCPTLGLPPDHQFTATWGFETFEGKAEKRE